MQKIFYLEEIQFGELRLKRKNPMILQCDKIADMHIVSNSVYHQTFQKVDCYFICEKSGQENVNYLQKVFPRSIYQVLSKLK